MAVVASAERIGELLVRDGLITREQLDRALADARVSGTRIGYSLVKLNFISEHDLALTLARQNRVPAVDLERAKLDPKLLKLIPAELALRHLVVPLRRVGRTLTVAMSAGEFSLRKVVEREYDVAEERMQDLLKQFDQEGEVEVLEQEEEELSVGTLQAQVEEAPVVKLINGLLNDAVARGASDIHFECYEKEVRVRYRIDGVLHEIMRPPPKMKAALISRFKILSDLKTAASSSASASA